MSHVSNENIGTEDQGSSGTHSPTQSTNLNDAESEAQSVIIASAVPPFATGTDNVNQDTDNRLRSRLRRNRQRAELSRQRRLQLLEQGQQTPAQLLFSQLEDECVRLRQENGGLWRQFMVNQVRGTSPPSSDGNNFFPTNFFTAIHSITVL
jgi:hypothetical protein